MNTIFTFVYAKGADDKFVKDIVERVESHGGKVCFVRLYCDRDELLRRVGNKSRRDLDKLTTKSGFNQMFRKYNLVAEVPCTDSFSLDTTRLISKQAATEIAVHYKIPIK